MNELSTAEEREQYRLAMEEVLDDEFTLDSFLSASSGTGSVLMRRMLTLLLHRVTFDINGLVVALETPNGAENIDFLRFSTQRISLSKSELAPSLDTSQDLSLSEASSNLVHKSLTFAGPTRLEVFSLPISAIPPHFHASALGSSNLQPAITIINEPLELAIDYSMQTDLKIKLQTQIRSLHAGIHASQLSSLMNVLKAYENTLSSAQVSNSPSTSGNHSRNVSSSINANGTSSTSVSGSRFSFSRYSGISRNHRADEEHDLQQSISRRLSNSALLTNFEVPPPPPSTFTHFQIEVQEVHFAFIPSTSLGTTRSPFLTLNQIQHPETTKDSFIQSSVTQLFISSDPSAQIFSAKSIFVSENSTAVSDTHWQYLPEFSRSYLPKQGYFRHKILSILPNSLDEANGLSISSHTHGGLAIDIGALEVSIPLALPKLTKIAIRNLNDAIEALDTRNTSNDSTSSSGSQISSSDALFSASKPDLMRSVTGHNQAQQLIWDSLFLGESFVFETGSYTSTSLRIGTASVIMELPLVEDIRFECLPLVRKERLRLEVKQIEAEISISDEDSFAPPRHSSHLDSSRSLDDGERGSRPYRAFSAIFDEATLMVERGWQSSLNNKQETTIIAILEGRTADMMAERHENARFEWRDFGRDLVGEHLAAAAKKDGNTKTTALGDEFDVEMASRQNLEKMHISRGLAARAPFSGKYRSGPHMGHTHVGDRQKEVLSRSEFSALAASPSELSIIFTVHMTTLHLSTVNYSVLMDAYDIYCHISALEAPNNLQRFNQVRELFGHSSPYLVDFRSKYALAHLYTSREPTCSEKRRHEEGPPAPSIDANFESLRILQTSRFLQTERSFLYATAHYAEMHDESSNTVLESKRLEKDAPPHVASFIYSNRIVAQDGANGHQKSETDLLIDLKDCVVTYGFDEKWPSRITSIFKRIANDEYTLFQPIGEFVADMAPEELDRFDCTLNLRSASIAVWGSASDDHTLFSSALSPGLSKGHNKTDSSSRLQAESPRLVASPQIVLVPHIFHLTIDMNSWLIKASWDRVDLFTTIDRYSHRSASLVSKQLKPTSAKSYWTNKRYLPAGAFGTGNLCYNSSPAKFSLEYGLQLITTPSQIVCLQLLYSAFANTWLAPQDASQSKESEHSLYSEAVEQIFPPNRLSSPPSRHDSSKEPKTRLLNARMTDSLISEDWLPETSASAPLTMDIHLKPADIVWRLRPEPSEEEENGDDNFETLDLNFSHLEFKYLVDENECSLMELMIKSVTGVSQLKDLREWSFLEFDASTGQSRLSPWYLSQRSDNQGYEPTAPLSMRFGRPSSSKSDSAQFRSFLNHDLSATTSMFSLSSQTSIYESQASSNATTTTLGPLKVDSLRFEMPRMHLTLRVRTFLFLHSFYRSYHSSSCKYALNDDPVQPQDNLFLDPGASSAVESAPTGPYFKNVFVGNLHLKISLPTLSDTDIHFPLLFLTDVVGWSALSSELWNVYEPGTRNLLRQLVSALPGLRLVRTVGYELWRLVMVPIDEAAHGRSATKGFFTALGSGIYNTVAEASSLGCTVLTATSRTVGLFTSYVGQASSSYSQNPESNLEESEGSTEEAQETTKDVYVPYASNLPDAAKQSLETVVNGVADVKKQVTGTIEHFLSEDGTYGELVLNSVITAPNAVLLPLNGVISGAGALLHGASRTMKARRDERPGQAETPIDLHIPRIDPNHESDSEEEAL